MLNSPIFWNSASAVSNTFWATLESIGILTTAYLVFHKWRKGKEAKEATLLAESTRLQEELDERDRREALQKTLEEMDTKFSKQHSEILKTLERINYAMFNAGKTGLVNRMDEVWEVIPTMEKSIAVLLDRGRNDG